MNARSLSKSVSLSSRRTILEECASLLGLYTVSCSSRAGFNRWCALVRPWTHPYVLVVGCHRHVCSFGILAFHVLSRLVFLSDVSTECGYVVNVDVRVCLSSQQIELVLDRSLNFLVASFSRTKILHKCWFPCLASICTKCRASRLSSYSSLRIAQQIRIIQRWNHLNYTRSCSIGWSAIVCNQINQKPPLCSSHEPEISDRVWITNQSKTF